MSTVNNNTRKRRRKRVIESTLPKSDELQRPKSWAAMERAARRQLNRTREIIDIPQHSR